MKRKQWENQERPDPREFMEIAKAVSLVCILVAMIVIGYSIIRALWDWL